MNSSLIRKIFTIACVSVMSVMVASQANAATYCVDDTSDGAANGADCDSDCTDGSANCSLRDAITQANTDEAADEIDLTGVAGTITLASALPTIGETLTITGPGADVLSISGADTYRIFNFDSGADDDSFIVSGLTLTNARITAGTGSAIGVGVGETLTINECEISSCTAANPGSGTIRVGGGNLIVLNSTIANNTGNNAGGGFLCHR